MVQESTTTTIPRHGIKASAALERVHCSSDMVVVSATGRVNTTYPASRMSDGAFQICGRGSTRKIQVTLAEHIVYTWMMKMMKIVFS